MKSQRRIPLLVLLAIPAAAIAQQSAPPSQGSTPSAPTFDSLDTNHDGMLSKDEFKAYFSQQHEQGEHGGSHHHGSSGGAPGGSGGGFGGHSANGGGFGGAQSGGQHYGGSHGGSHGGNRENPDQMFENLDTNHDGVLSREEFAAMAHGGGSSSGSGSGNYHGSSTPAPHDNKDLPSN
jgi:hypothetical protein